MTLAATSSPLDRVYVTLKSSGHEVNLYICAMNLRHALGP